MQYESKARTIVYIDGFNLYYGCLKDSKYKWLNLKTLFSLLLKNHDIVGIKYFTARVTARKQNDNSPNRQNAYLKALKQYAPEIDIFFGHFLDSYIKAKVYNPPKNCPKFVTVHKTEEKGSDVNMALHILDDAWKNKYACAAIVSNDSDLSEALRLVKTEHNKKIGLILPIDSKKRKPSHELIKHADFIKIIRSGVLSKSLLPDEIPGTNIRKPANW